MDFWRALQTHSFMPKGSVVWTVKGNHWHLYYQSSNTCCCCSSPWTKGLLMEVLNYKSLAMGLQRKYNQAVLKFSFSHIHWKYQNQLEHRNKNDAYVTKCNGWLLLVYEILISIFWEAIHRICFLAEFFSHLVIISLKCSSSLFLGVCPICYVLSEVLPAPLRK